MSKVPPLYTNSEAVLRCRHLQGAPHCQVDVEAAPSRRPAWGDRGTRRSRRQRAIGTRLRASGFGHKETFDDFARIVDNCIYFRQLNRPIYEDSRVDSSRASHRLMGSMRGTSNRYHPLRMDRNVVRVSSRLGGNAVELFDGRRSLYSWWCDHIQSRIAHQISLRLRIGRGASRRCCADKQLWLSGPIWPVTASARSGRST